MVVLSILRVLWLKGMRSLATRLLPERNLRSLEDLAAADAIETVRTQMQRKLDHAMWQETNLWGS